MNGEPLIVLKDVTLKFGEREVHRGVSFSINQGESVTLIGPSGTGKTLILKLIMGLLQPTSGTVKVLGVPLNSISEDGLATVRSKIGMLFQSAALFDSLSVYENIAYPLRECGQQTEESIAETVANLLSVIGLPGIEESYPPQLSGGQKKRVGLARALARSPKIVLFDEPTTGLDPTATRLIDDLIIKLRQTWGLTSIAVTHDIASARRISDRWILLDNGKVVADGAVNEVANSNRYVADFISGNWKED